MAKTRVTSFGTCPAVVLLCASVACAQEKPLARSFAAGTVESYQVLISLKAETHGVSTETIGEKTYVKPFTHEARGSIQWKATRQIGEVKADGSAAIAEKLAPISSACADSQKLANADRELERSLEDLCTRWQSLSSLAYEEEKYGAIHGLPEQANWLAGPDLPFLSLWLRRALRPSLILSKEPMHFGVRLGHRVGDPLNTPGSPSGTEESEWTEAGGELPAATYHVAQDLSWLEQAELAKERKTGRPAAGRKSFYADSLSTVSLLDGSLLSASRSASYETKQVLDRVPGLPEAPEFGSKLTITVTMRRLP